MANNSGYIFKMENNSKYFAKRNDLTVIDYARKRYEECCDNDKYEGARYWAAYLDGAKAQMKESWMQLSQTIKLPVHNTGKCRIFQCSGCGYGYNDIFLDDEGTFDMEHPDFCAGCGSPVIWEEDNANK